MRILKNRKRAKVLLLSGLCGIAFGAWALHTFNEKHVDVRVASPAFADVIDYVTTNGTVEPLGEFQARADFPGTIESVSVELGDRVRPGQLLVTMKDPFADSRIATAQTGVSGANTAAQDMAEGGSQEDRINYATDLERATAGRDHAKQYLDLVQQLQTQGAVGTGEVEGAKQRLEDSNVTLTQVQQRATKRFSGAAVKAARDRLLDANANLAAMKASFNNAHIASPIAGTVYSVSVSPYDFVSMGADLLRVADLRNMQIRAYFDEPEVGKLKEGQESTITWDARPGATWNGHIRKAPVAAKPLGDRSVAECLIQLDNSDGTLLPNTHVIVKIPIEKHLHVLTVPRMALQARGKETWVYRVVDGKLVQTPVIVGLVNLDLAEVRSGLSPQDVVAVYDLANQPLVDGLAVTSKQ